MTMRDEIEAELAKPKQANNARRVQAELITELRCGHLVTATLFERISMVGVVLRKRLEMVSAVTCGNCRRQAQEHLANEIGGMMLSHAVIGDELVRTQTETTRRNARDLVSILRVGQAAPMMFRRAS